MGAPFPWIKGHRLRVICRDRKVLRIDDHLRKLHVAHVENIELGALTYQSCPHLSCTQMEHLETLAAMRNDLAHRMPVNTQHFDLALRASDILR